MPHYQIRINENFFVRKYTLAPVSRPSWISRIHADLGRYLSKVLLKSKVKLMLRGFGTEILE